MTTKEVNSFVTKTIDVVCGHFGINKEMLKKESRNRSDRFVQPRQIIIYILCNHVNLRDHVIADIFGHERSSVPYARGKVSGRMKIYPEYESLVRSLQQMCIADD